MQDSFLWFGSRVLECHAAACSAGPVRPRVRWGLGTALVLLVGAAAVCFAPLPGPAGYDRIRDGMTLEEVTGILSDPAGASGSTDPEGRLSGRLFWTSPEWRITVEFTRGVVA